ncbi:sensor histidine kinase [Halobacteroides halobius]|nr:ATP-binding protein [Halobacteroides halobius]
MSVTKDLKQINLKQLQTSDSILDSILIPKKIEAKQLGIELIYQIDPGIEEIKLSLNKIFRIVSNLVDNAVDAIEVNNEGTEQIRVEGIKEDERYILSIYNTGSYIEPKLLDDLFKAGVSSKGRERGYGLYIVNSLVEQGHGEIEVKSDKDYGTEFKCYFSLK